MRIRIYIGIIICMVVSVLHPPGLEGQIAFPGAEGYGSKTRGAYGGSVPPKILIVDNLNPGNTGSDATGRGTFTWCINRSYPRIVLFEVEGVIDYRGRPGVIPIEYPYLTIAGQTSPGNGITIIGAGIDIRGQYGAHDIIIQHIKIRHGDDPNGYSYNQRDCINIMADDVIVDHCSFSWSTDEMVGMVPGFYDVTISNCIMAEPLYLSGHHYESGNLNPEPHGLAMLLDGPNLTLKNNLIAYSFDRNPLIRSDSVVIINNMMYNATGVRMGVLFDGSRIPKMNGCYIGNLVLRTASTTNTISSLAALVHANVHLDSRLFFDDNICVKSITTPGITEREKIWLGNPDFQLAPAPPMDLAGYNIINASDVETYIMENVGAKPFERDVIDERILSQVRNRTGELINSQDPLPARAYNFGAAITGSNAGYMANGYDWAASPSSITVNGTVIQLNQKCTTLQQVLDLINPQLPSAVETFVHPCGTFIGFRTKLTGSAQSLAMSGTGLAAFGIPAGTYAGENGVGGFPAFPAGSRSLATITGYPSTNPNGDDNGNGYSNLEEWLYALGTGTTELLAAEATPNGPAVVCQGSQAIQYTTVGTPKASTYSWELNPSNAGQVSGTGTSISIDWQPAFFGDCKVTFYAYGPSSFSAVSPPLTVQVSPKPMPPVMPTGPNQIFQNAPEQVYGLSESSISETYEWHIYPPEAGVLIPSGVQCMVNWNEPFFGNCYLSVRGVNDCGAGEYSDSLLIQVQEVELGYGIINIFTPNGDGFNDYWSLPFIRDFPDAVIKIFDRNNKLLIEYRGTDSSWNGTVNGSLVPMGNYLYVIDLRNGKPPIRGYVTVLR